MAFVIEGSQSCRLLLSAQEIVLPRSDPRSEILYSVAHDAWRCLYIPSNLLSQETRNKTSESSLAEDLRVKNDFVLCAFDMAKSI